MTSFVVAPVVPPSPRTHQPVQPAGHGAARAGVRRVLPLAPLATIRDCGTVYGVAAVDSRGRIADHHVMTALGWSAGTRLDIQESGGLVLVRANRQGVFSVTSQGHLRLPVTVRQWCRLTPGDRVMLAADPAEGLLAVYPPAALDAMIMLFHASVLGGEAA
jgi:hypothetical protein